MVKLDTTQGYIALATDPTANTTIGVLLNEPLAGDVARVRLLNTTVFVIAAAAFSIGATLAVTTGGQVQADTTAGHAIVGIALEAAGAQGDRVEMMICNKYYHA